MKPLTLLIAVSLALNVALAVLILSSHNEPDTAAPMAPISTAAAAPAAPVVDGETWTKLNSEDLPALVRELREAGFPPNIVRAIAAARVRESFAARHRAIDPAAESRPHWKNSLTDPKLQLAARQLYREERKALSDLLGEEADANETVNTLFQGRRLDSVPADKVDDVRRALREFDDARSEIYSAGGSMGSEQQRKIAALEKEHREALARILDPKELEDYELRNSDTARNVRFQLSAFNPTEEEFRAIYKLQSDFDARFGRMYTIPSPEEQQRRSDAQRQMNDQIKATLGPVRGADYERATDFNYRQTSQLVTRLELPPETVDAVYAVQKDIQGRLQGTFRDPMPAEERNAKLAEFATEARTRVTTILGDRGFEAYKQYGGSWMQSFTRRPEGSNPPTSATGTLIIRGSP